MKFFKSSFTQTGLSRRAFAILVIVVFSLTLVVHIQMFTRYKAPVKTNVQVKSVQPRNNQPIKYKRKPNNPKTYLVTWYDMITFLQKRPWAASANFSVCDYNNCKISRNKRLVSKSDVVLFQGRFLPTTLRFKRPNGQIWVFVDVEPPTIIERLSQKKTRYGVEKFKHEFNWTMTYDKKLADIHLPYGELRKHKKYVDKNYTDIALNKTKGGLIVVSHCPVDSKRLDYIKELQETIDVTVLGACGTEWDCGRRMFHDDCFSILNGEYAYYLAFENSLCHQYYTEKLYENFKYDTLFVTRGGLPHEATSFFPKGTVIDHDAFLSPQDLGEKLKGIMDNKKEYARRLAIKSQYYSIDFRESYQRALCDLCYRLNHQDQFYKTIPDILQVLSKKHSCRDGKDLT